ncbi:von Willebrand factor type A domain protein [Candidatus Magnetoovum chiemensis]|nr:von Willebrand factor type A domain protein [Candidatus Magnetoovum chiemensis]
MIFFKNPLLLILIPVLLAAAILINKNRKTSTIRFSTSALLKDLGYSYKTVLYKNLHILRLTALTLSIIAFARPQAVIKETLIETEGIDIALAIDISTSMLAEDFSTLNGKRQNRVDAVKDVVREFVKGRYGDRIALVVFSGQSYTVSPLTIDYNWLLTNLDRVYSGMIEDGTAIGSGLAAALNRLKDTNAKSKVVILLTDGRNNMGQLSPLSAAEAAKALNIKVYTIGAGSKGPVPYPTHDMFGNTVYANVIIDIDDETLTKIAQITNAKYFRATDTETLRNIYKEIDTLEKTKIEQKGFYQYKELFHLFLIPCIIILIIEIILKNTTLQRIP